MHGHEERRLFFVGATRARDHLIVSLHHKAGSKSNAALLTQVPELDPLWAELDLEPGKAAEPVEVASSAVVAPATRHDSALPPPVG